MDSDSDSTFLCLFIFVVVSESDDTRGLLFMQIFFSIEIEHLYQFPKQIISSDAGAVFMHAYICVGV